VRSGPAGIAIVIGGIALLAATPKLVKPAQEHRYIAGCIFWLIVGLIVGAFIAF
jgi:hypothetical protein